PITVATRKWQGRVKMRFINETPHRQGTHQIMNQLRTRTQMRTSIELKGLLNRKIVLGLYLSIFTVSKTIIRTVAPSIGRSKFSPQTRSKGYTIWHHYDRLE